MCGQLKMISFLAQNLNFDRLGIIYVSRTACNDIISYFLAFHYLSSVSVEKYFFEQAGAELGQAQPKLRFKIRLNDFQRW